ncbi:MAG: hypothetical protein R3E79_17640 [Caldilineaceae bacterium]
MMNTQQVDLLLDLTQERQVRLQQAARKIHQIKRAKQPALSALLLQGQWQLRHGRLTRRWLVFG